MFIKPVASPLRFVIKNLIEESKFRDRWEIACISSKPIITNSTELKDYRPISVLPTLLKVYEKLVLLQIIDFMERQKHAINANMDVTKLFISNHSFDIIWWCQTSNKRQWGNNCYFCWLFKGFYTLKQKIHSRNFSLEFLYTRFLNISRIQHFVHIDSNYSSFPTAKYRVSQVSTLKHILFNFCVANMSSITPKSNCIQYIDG